MKTLQEELINLPGESIFAESVRLGAKEDFEGCVKMIKDQYADNGKMVERILGTELLNKIESL